MSYLLAFLLPEPVDPTLTPTPPSETPHKPTSAIPGASADYCTDAPGCVWPKGHGGNVHCLTVGAPPPTSPHGGYTLCACHGGALTPDEARAGSLCEGCGGRR